MPDAVQGETGYIPLEPGAQVYVFADVQNARPILDLVPIGELDDKQSKQMLDLTSSAVAALYPAESGRRFQLTAWGKYPSSRAGMAFGMSRGWKKQRSVSGAPYWYSAGSGLSVFLKAKQAFAAASVNATPGDPFTASPGTELPEGLDEFRRGALIACWLEKPGPMINRIFERMQIPLQLPAERIFISLFPVPEQERQYQALIRIRTPSATQARALVTLIAMARAFGAVPTAASGEPDAQTVLMAVLFANAPAQDGPNLNIKSAVLSEKEIALLFSLFQIYSG
ncbi:hypothetical protein AGMMS50293_14980 [Spirochaetia bacterium]|nr:hypothetical protein AGMMS50293_14980 [Spirochaetia bacterium]